MRVQNKRPAVVLDDETPLTARAPTFWKCNHGVGCRTARRAAVLSLSSDFVTHLTSLLMSVVSSSEPTVVRKSFFRRSKRGQISKVVHEKYLRQDDCVGYLGATRTAVSKSEFKQLYGHSEYIIVLDTNIALQELDVLEYKATGNKKGMSNKGPLHDLVILQTVLTEVKHNNLSAYQRVKNMLSDEDRQCLFIPNEMMVDTHVLRNKDESMNDANDRGIRQVCQFLQGVLGGEDKAKVLLLSHDMDNQRKAIEIGVSAMSIRDYLSTQSSTDARLLDLLAAHATDDKAVMRISYPPHINSNEIASGLTSGKYLRGVIRCRDLGESINSWTECYAVVKGREADAERQFISINSAWRVNRAVDGDVVAIEIVDETPSSEEQSFLETFKLSMEQEDDSQVSAFEDGADDVAEGVTVGGTGAIADGFAGMTAEEIEGIDSTQATATSTNVRVIASGPKKLYGRIVGIIRRNWRKYAGSVDMSSAFSNATLDKDSMDIATTGGLADTNDEGTGVSTLAAQESYLFVPVDKKIPRIRVSTRQKEVFKNSRLLVTIDDWPRDSVYPLGHYVQRLGTNGDKEVETKVLLHEFDVPHEAFTAEVMSCLPPMDWQITPDIVAQRTDLRHIPVVSIDPPGCKDIDDALHCTRLPNGRLQAGVHIADVTYFVHPDSALDKEAAHRATSTYLVERRLDMLPSLLTTELCSLRSKEDHLAFSVIWEMDDEGNIYDVDFCKSVIHSVASLTYDEAQVMLDSPTDETDQVAVSVKLLNQIAKILRKQRIDMGALTLASPEVRFKMDEETENPTDVNMYVLKEANALVEEWMLLANITVSKKVLRHFPTLGVLRRHQPPSQEQFAPLLSAAIAAGVSLNIQSSKTLADSLDMAVKEDDSYFNKLLRIMSTRVMSPAQYFCSGQIPKDQWHHYGLAAPIYTHFTSPIRRYADVIVHRLLAAAIGVFALPAGNADKNRQQDLCAHLNRRHRAAQYAQRASVQLYTLLYFKDRPSKVTAYVLGVDDEAVKVLVPKYGIEGALNIKTICDRLSTTYKHESKYKVEFVHKNTGITILSLTIFQKVDVDIRVLEKLGDRILEMNLHIDYLEANDTRRKRDTAAMLPATTSSPNKKKKNNK